MEGPPSRDPGAEPTALPESILALGADIVRTAFESGLRLRPIRRLLSPAIEFTARLEHRQQVNY